MNCKNCGETVQPFDKFCPKCGTQTDEQIPFTNFNGQINHKNQQYGQFETNNRSFVPSEPSFHVQSNLQSSVGSYSNALNRAFSSGWYIASCILLSVATLITLIGLDDFQIVVTKDYGDINSGLATILTCLLPAIGCVAMWCLFAAAYNRKISNSTMCIKVIDVVQKIQWGTTWLIAALYVLVAIIMAFGNGSETSGRTIGVLIAIAIFLAPPVLSAVFGSVTLLMADFLKDLIEEKTIKIDGPADAYNYTIVYTYITLLVIVATILVLAVLWVFINRGVSSVKNHLNDGDDPANNSFGFFVVCLILGCMHLFAIIIFESYKVNAIDLTAMELISQLCYGGAMIALGVTFLRLKNIEQPNSYTMYMR